MSYVTKHGIEVVARCTPLFERGRAQKIRIHNRQYSTEQKAITAAQHFANSAQTTVYVWLCDDGKYSVSLDNKIAA